MKPTTNLDAAERYRRGWVDGWQARVEMELDENEMKPANKVFRGLIRETKMPPMRAMVLMNVYEQFPDRFVPGNGGFFKPSIGKILANLPQSSEIAVHDLIGQLVDEGYLSKRKAKIGFEYRIEFGKLERFVK